MTNHLLRIMALLSVVLPAAGCGQQGPKIAPVAGVVTHDGKPVGGAMVEFQPDEGAPSYAFTESDGSYSLQYQADRQGAVLGHHTVRIRTPREVTDPNTGETIIKTESIPEAYNDQSQLEFTVNPGQNTFDIAIEGTR